MTKTALTQAFDQLKLQIGEDKFSGLFEPAFWLEREREQIEEAWLSGYSYIEPDISANEKDYYNSKYRGEE